MADTDQERTEDATPKRLQEAREKGQIPRSKELTTATVLIAASLGLLVFGELLAKAMVVVFSSHFSLSREQVYDPNHMIQTFGNVLSTLLWPMLVILAIVSLAGIIGSILLGGANFSWQAAAPKMNKISPLQGFKRMFGMQAMVELIKSIAKVAIIAGVAWAVMRWQFNNIMALSMQSFPASAVNALDILQWMLLALVCSLVVIAAIDVPYQIWNHAKQLRMTKQEIKDEYKNTEGSPELKGRIRRMQMEMANRRMMADVPQADVVVTNPTHYSVALKYDKSGNGAPILVAKGADEVALKIREIAAHYKVPTIQSPALTRSLYHTTRIGKEIPEGLFVAVAQVLAYVFQLEQYRKGQAQRPKTVSRDLPIPEDLRY